MTTQTNGPRLARIVAQIAASEAQHAELLRTGTKATSLAGAGDSGTPAGGFDIPPRDGALQSALAGEHAMVWAYGVASGRLSGADRDRAIAAMAAHRRRRNEMRTALATSAEAVGPLAAYALPFEVDDPNSAGRLAALVETRSQVALADLVAAADAGERPRFTAWLTGASIDALRWGGQPRAFPGSHESTSVSTSPSLTATPSG